MTDYVGIGGSDLFSFDNKVALDSHILYDNEARSKIEYDEYVVYKRQYDMLLGHSAEEHRQNHVAHKISHDDKEGADMLHGAFREGKLVDCSVCKNPTRPRTALPCHHLPRLVDPRG